MANCDSTPANHYAIWRRITVLLMLEICKLIWPLTIFHEMSKANNAIIDLC